METGRENKRVVKKTGGQPDLSKLFPSPSSVLGKIHCMRCQTIASFQLAGFMWDGRKREVDRR